ncbi:hypothetical protein LTR22_022130 [Elasticomyces elasticus]|nr:hypothetical protein LTR22_022130 [Elasticomyces elasticus]KAK4906888.1 hypothetical protein LTR49_024038 [Elasticomyces elasticus]KAK5766254.1 hypothetical protein LTS12_003465 [Elasticomyces elasticus]
MPAPEVAAVTPRSTASQRTRHNGQKHTLEDEHAPGGEMAPKRARWSPQASASNSNVSPPVDDAEDIHEDDICPVCQLLLFNPVITACKHVLCKSCMATWADVSLSTPMIIVSVDEEPKDFDSATGLEAKCPMCRMQTSASLDEARHAVLRSKYPHSYIERQTEEAEIEDSRESIQTITLYIGNRHSLVTPAEGSSSNTHDWTFFVKPSRTDIIEEVQILLHPTFRPSRIIRSRPPYEIRRLGWGYFTITAAVILRAGYGWVSSDAEPSPDGVENGMLRLEWGLDFSSFDGKGAMGRCRLKVKNDRQWDGGEDSEDEREMGRMVKQYQRDARYEPPEED